MKMKPPKYKRKLEDEFYAWQRIFDELKIPNDRLKPELASSALTLDAYQWKCAYCQEKPFEVMHHHIPLHEGGSTLSNCLPACRPCCSPRKKKPPDQAPLID